jgi:nitrilase
MRIALISSSDVARVCEERHNFDPAGHYGRPDPSELRVDRRRLSVASFSDDPPGRD